MKIIKHDTSAHIVVGAGYGDEGKGTTVDYLCNSKFNPIVIRFSGGPQAGHTVQIEGGSRHTHSNFGSGTFRNNTPTLFSEHTLVYPVTIEREREVLIDKGCEPSLFVHPLAKIITPWDVYDNRHCNRNLEHGSCGLGIHKTMVRNEVGPKLYAIDLLDEQTFNAKIIEIQAYYKNLWFTNGVIFAFNEWLENEIAEFHNALKCREWEVKGYEVLEDYTTLVFEGSQGILLDMDHGVFPYVTHANTTSKNAIDILDKIGWGAKSPSIYYITRSYSTRHGEGPFIQQEVPLTMEAIEESNVTNKYQGDFKLANINYDRLSYAISIDKLYSGDCRTVLVVTCLDQQAEFDETKINHDFNMVIYSMSPDSRYFRIVKP